MRLLAVSIGGVIDTSQATIMATMNPCGRVSVASMAKRPADPTYRLLGCSRLLYAIRIAPAVNNKMRDSAYVMEKTPAQGVAHIIHVVRLAQTEAGHTCKVSL
jgi:hypothetical protein